MKESSIQKQIIAYINTIGYCIKVVSATKSGVPDIIACIPNKAGVGLFYAFEVKNSDGGVTSMLQQYNIDLIRECGGVTFVVSSLKEVKKIIKDESEVF